jgi:hypothetical protein
VCHIQGPGVEEEEVQENPAAAVASSLGRWVHLTMRSHSRVAYGG